MFTLNINYIDDDQVIMWLGAKEYSQGIFHEPRFYGQSYNTFMEALFAVPFIWMQIPVYYAVPLATHIIFLTPFIFTALYLYKHKLIEKAILVLALLLCMPAGFDVMSSVPRGFITGIFFTIFFVINLINPKQYKFIFINTLFSVIGFLVNPNSILVSIPFLFYLFLSNYNDKKYYKATVLAFIASIPFELLLNQFYRSNPQYIVYTFDNEVALKYFLNAISKLNQHFGHVGLFIEGTYIVTLIVFIIIGIYFFKENKKWFFAFLGFVSIIVFSLFFQKISHGGAWPFFSLSRMFIAIPTFFMFSVILFKKSINKTIYLLIGVVLIFTIYKESTFNEKLLDYGKSENFLDVSLFNLQDVFKMSNDYKQVCIKYNTNKIVIIGWTWRDNIIHYAGPALDDNYPETFKPHFERRRWITDKEFKTIPSSFIIYTRHKNLDILCKQKYKDVKIQKLDDWGTYYVYNNKLTTVNFIKQIGAETLGF